MQTHFLFDVLDGYKPFEQMAQESQNSGAVIAASGMAGAQKAHAACALAARTGRPLLFLCDSERSATQTMEDVSALLGGGVCLLPAREITFYQDVAASREVAYRRIEAMPKGADGLLLLIEVVQRRTLLRGEMLARWQGLSAHFAAFLTAVDDGPLAACAHGVAGWAGREAAQDLVFLRKAQLLQHR